MPSCGGVPHAAPSHPANPWHRLEEAIAKEWYNQRWSEPDYKGPYLPVGPASYGDVLQAVGKLMGVGPKAAREHFDRLVAFGILRPSRDEVTVLLEEAWRVSEFNRLFYADEYARFQLGERGVITEDELRAAARLWARLPDGTRFEDILDRDPDEMRPRFIHARILALELMLHGLGVWPNKKGYDQPPPKAPAVIRRIELHNAARREIKARIAQRRLVDRMVVSNQRGLDDAIDLGVAVGIFTRQARGESQPFVQIDWEHLYDAMALASHRRILCCPCREAAVENGRDDEEEWSHYLECVAAKGDPHHGGREIPVVEWDGKSSLSNFLDDDTDPAKPS